MEEMYFLVCNEEIHKFKKFTKEDIISNITEDIKSIESTKIFNDTHVSDKNKLINTLKNYLTEGFEDHYPYICFV